MSAVKCQLYGAVQKQGPKLLQDALPAAAVKMRAHLVLIFIRKLFPCSVHNSFMLHLIVPVRAPLKFPIMFTGLDHIIFGFRCVQSLRKNRLRVGRGTGVDFALFQNIALPLSVSETALRNLWPACP